ncbi:MAG TPA: ABC transporter ATP-binding protein [Halanaerobiales bacterium]|nr:ABC transporter ATP-binding protein [Halanaerobiales bacterium]
MLEIYNLYTSYGPVQALKDVSIEANKDKIVCIIGSNGAGKTTLLNCISALVKSDSGKILLEGKELSKKAHSVVKEGIVQIPEGRRVFSDLKVKENLHIGGFLLNNKSQLKENFNLVYDLFPRLEERKNQYAGTLSGGEQQMLAIARGLMSNPKLMLLDEPSLGLAPQLVNTVFNFILEIKKRGITILLVEQNAKKALELCDYAYVLENGKIVLSGKGDELIKDEEVKKAYLG